MLAVLSQKVRVLGLRGALNRALWIVTRDGWTGVRKRITHWVHAGTAPYVTQPVTPAAPAGSSNNGINLVGHPYGALGMGEHIRKSAQAFEAARVPFTIFNTFDQAGPYGDRFPEFPLHDRIVREHPHRVSLFHLNADEMPLASAHLGAAFFAGRYNIGYWAWELAKFPDAWTGAFGFFDEIWAPSRFIQQAVADKAPCPVVHMPLAVEFAAAPALSRRHLGLPERRFLFLFYFDFNSYVARKNPLAVIAAFRRAFPQPDRSNVALVIKVNGVEQKANEYRAFVDDLGARSGIVLVDRVMTDHEVRSLVQGCDAFVSLHRSEGFGRGMAEAMYYGKPVIGTAYSGNLDFMHAENACLVDAVLVPVREGEYPHAQGQVWAEPDVDQAAQHMQRIHADAQWRAALGARAAATIRVQNSFDAVGRRYRDRLVKLGFVAP